MRRRVVVAVLFVVASAAYADLPQVTVKALSESGGYVPSMTIGPDGAVWFAASTNNQIGRSPLSGDPATTFPVPTANAGLNFMTTGPDGNVWFLETNAGKIGKISTAGTITEYALTGLSFPAAMAAGSDGNLWIFAFNGPNGVLGRFSTSGTQLSSITLPGSASRVKLAQGPGAAIWFHDRGGNTVGFVTASGSVQSFPFSTADTAGGLNAAGGLAAGPDGNMWVAHSAALARVTPSGTITEYPVAGAAVLAGVATGTDGNIWFTDAGTGKLGRLLISTATTSGTATIDQTSLGGSPAGIFVVPAGSAPGRVANASPALCAGGEFVIYKSDTPPPHLIVVSLPPTPCADMAITFSGITGVTGVSATVTAKVTNNGPDAATPTVTVDDHSINGASICTANFQVNGSETACKLTASTHAGESDTIESTSSYVCTAPAPLAPGDDAYVKLHVCLSILGITTAKGTDSFVVGSDLPDNNPKNNAASGSTDYQYQKSIGLPPDPFTVVAVSKRR